MVTELESTTNRCRTYHLNPIFAMSTNTTQAYDWVSSFDHLQVDDESAEMTTLGLSPHSISANAALKTDNEVFFPLLSDPKSILIHAMGLDFSGRGKKVGVFALDRAGILLAHAVGKAEDVL